MKHELVLIKNISKAISPIAPRLDHHLSCKIGKLLKQNLTNNMKQACRSRKATRCPNLKKRTDRSESEGH